MYSLLRTPAIVAAVTSKTDVTGLLEHLGLPTDAPGFHAARPRPQAEPPSTPLRCWRRTRGISSDASSRVSAATWLRTNPCAHAPGARQIDFRPGWTNIGALGSRENRGDNARGSTPSASREGELRYNAVHIASPISLELSEPSVDSFSLLVEDGRMLGSGQARKAESIRSLQPELEAIANQELARTPFSALGCPWIAYYLEYFARQPIERSRAIVSRWLGRTTYTSLTELRAAILDRARLGVRRWRETGETPNVAEIPPPNRSQLALLGASTIGGLATGWLGLFRARSESRGEAGLSPVEALSGLGAGEPLESQMSNRAQSTFGGSFADVRVHSGASADHAASRAGAHAFTVGEHIVLGSARQMSSPLLREVLLAHELAHVAQQRRPGHGTAGGLERDADRGALAFVEGRRAPQSGASLRLQRCSGGPEAEDLAGAGSVLLNAYSERLRPLYAEYQLITNVPVEQRSGPQLVRMGELRRQAAAIAEEMRRAGFSPRVLSIYLRTLTGDEEAYPEAAHAIHQATERIGINSSTGDDGVVNEEATFQWATWEEQAVARASGSPARHERASGYVVTAPDGRTQTFDSNRLLLRFDQEGRWRVAIDVRIVAENRVVTVSREVDVRDPEAIADTVTATSGLARRFENMQGRPGAATGALIRANLELERIRVGRFREITETNTSRTAPYITSRDPNPVDANSDPDRKIHRYSVTPSRSGSMFRWYAVPDREMPQSGFLQHIGTATAGQTSFGSGGIHNLTLESQVVDGRLAWVPPGGGLSSTAGFRYPVVSAELVTIYCDEVADGQTIATARYRQVILPRDQWAQYTGIERTIARFAEHYPNIAENTEVPISAVHVARASGQTMQTTFLLGRKTSDANEYLLLDMTPGVSRVEYEADSLTGLWEDLNSGNSYPVGILRLTIPFNNALGITTRTVTIQTSGASDWSEFASSTGWASLGLTALGVVGMFIPGGQVFAAICFIAGGTLGVASGAASLYDRLQQAEVSTTGVAIDVLSIASSFFGSVGAARAAVLGPRVALATGVGRFFLYAGFTTDAFAGVLVGIDTMQQINRILESGIDRAEAIGQIVRLLAMAALNGGLVMLSARDLTQVRTRVAGALGETRLTSLALTSDQFHTLDLLDDATLAAMRNVPDHELPSLIEAIRRDPGAATADIARIRAMAAEGGRSVRRRPPRASLRVDPRWSRPPRNTWIVASTPLPRAESRATLA